MIRSHFSYASVRTGFGSAGAASYRAWQSDNARVSSAITTAETGSSSTSPFDGALQDNLSGLATLAANAAIARVQADAKAKSAVITQQIDSAQSALNDANSVNAPAGTTVVGYSVIQKYVSWAVLPTVDTTA